jgi:hypothetical protein
MRFVNRKPSASIYFLEIINNKIVKSLQNNVLKIRFHKKKFLHLNNEIKINVA